MKALLRLPDWVNFPTSRAEMLPKERLSWHLVRWLREIVPVCANTTPAQFAVPRTEHGVDRFEAVTQAVVPAQQSTPVPLVQGLQCKLLCPKRHGDRNR